MTDCTRSIISTRIGQPVFMMDAKVFKANTADGLMERTSSMLDEVESKTVHKDEEGDQ